MKKILAILMLLLSVQHVKALTIRDFFISEPGNVFELLTQGSRAAMITMAEAGEMITVENRCNGHSSILNLDSTYMEVKCSESKTLQLKMLTRKKDTVIAVVETLNLPTPDSKIWFYDSKWKPLLWSKHIKGGVPTLKDFVKPDAPKDKVAELMKSADFELISMSFADGDHSKLVVTQQMKSFLGKEEYGKWAPYLLDKIEYRISDTRLERVK